MLTRKLKTIYTLFDQFTRISTMEEIESTKKNSESEDSNDDDINLKVPIDKASSEIVIVQNTSSDILNLKSCFLKNNNQDENKVQKSVSFSPEANKNFKFKFTDGYYLIKHHKHKHHL